MARRGIKKMGAVLIAAGLSIAMCSSSVSANVICFLTISII